MKLVVVATQNRESWICLTEGMSCMSPDRCAPIAAPGRNLEVHDTSHESRVERPMPSQQNQGSNNWFDPPSVQRGVCTGLWSGCEAHDGIVRWFVAPRRLARCTNDSHYTSGLHEFSYVFDCFWLFKSFPDRVDDILQHSTMSSPCLVYRFTPWVDDPHPAAAQSAAQRIRVHTQQRGSLLQRSESNSKTKVHPKSKWYLKLSHMSRNWQLLCTMRRQAELWNLTDLPFPKSLHPIGQKLPHLKALGDRASGTCPWVLLKEVLLQDATVHLEALLRCFPDLRLSLPRKDLPNAPIPQAPGAQSKFMELPIRFEEMFLWVPVTRKDIPDPPNPHLLFLKINYQGQHHLCKFRLYFACKTTLQAVGQQQLPLAWKMESMSSSVKPTTERASLSRWKFFRSLSSSNKSSTFLEEWHLLERKNIYLTTNMLMVNPT